jgi:hypothetical protein
MFRATKNEKEEINIATVEGGIAGSRVDAPLYLKEYCARSSGKYPLP